jgi:hypothetical protein
MGAPVIYTAAPDKLDAFWRSVRTEAHRASFNLARAFAPEFVDLVVSRARQSLEAQGWQNIRVFALGPDHATKILENQSILFGFMIGLALQLWSDDDANQTVPSRPSPLT